MRTTTGTYDTENAKDDKFPVILVQFAGVTREYASQTFSGIGSSVRKYLRTFFINFGKLDLLKGIQDLGQTNFTIEDIGDDFTSTLNTDPIVDKVITVKYGYQALTESNFVTLSASETSETVELSSDLLTYSVTAQNIRNLLKGDIGRNIPETVIPSDMSDSGALTSLTVGSTTGFIDPTSLPSQDPVGNRSYIKIDSEIISYRAIGSSTTFTDAGSSAFLGRGLMGTQFVAHSAGSLVSQMYNFHGMFPTEIILYVLMTTDDGSGHAFYDLAAADLGYKGMGYGLSASEVDVEGIERLGWKLFNLRWEDCQVVGLFEKTNGVEWLSDNILKPAGLFLYVNSDNKVSITSIDRLHLFEDFVANDDLTESDIKIINYKIDNKQMINHIEFQKRTDVFGGQDGLAFDDNPLITKLDDSETEYGLRTDKFVINSPLIPYNIRHHYESVALGTAVPTDSEIMDNIIRRWFYTYGNPLGILEFEVSPDKWLLEPTDWITITHSKMPDTLDGGRGWTSKKFYIISQEMTPLSNLPRFKYKAITWEAYDKLNDFYENVTTITQGSITDTSLDFNSNASATNNTEDAHHDFGSPLGVNENEVFRVTLEITPPGNGSTHHWLQLEIFLIDLAGPTVQTDALDVWRGVRYLSSESVAYDVEFILFVRSAVTVEQIKIDWFNGSSDGLEGGGTERPTIVFKKLVHMGRGEAMTIL